MARRPGPPGPIFPGRRPRGARGRRGDRLAAGARAASFRREQGVRSLGGLVGSPTGFRPPISPTRRRAPSTHRDDGERTNKDFRQQRRRARKPGGPTGDRGQAERRRAYEDLRCDRPRRASEHHVRQSPAGARGRNRGVARRDWNPDRRVLMDGGAPFSGGYLNNRAEVPHPPTRTRERQTRGVVWRTARNRDPGLLFRNPLKARSFWPLGWGPGRRLSEPIRRSDRFFSSDRCALMSGVRVPG